VGISGPYACVAAVTGRRALLILHARSSPPVYLCRSAELSSPGRSPIQFAAAVSSAAVHDTAAEGSTSKPQADTRKRIEHTEQKYKVAAVWCLT
jgi:hypothetical protein